MILRFPLFILGISIQLVSLAQSDSLQRQINQQVWKPFIQSFINYDTDGFMAVHSKQMSRVIQDSRIIYGYDRYAEQQRRGDENARKQNQKRDIELRFTERMASNGRAFEIGYYKSTTIMADGKSYTGYGKFHVLLINENGRWKILMDADAGSNVNEQIFQSAAPLE